MTISKALIIVTQVKDPADARSGTLSIESRVFCPGIGVDEDSVVGLFALSTLHVQHD